MGVVTASEKQAFVVRILCYTAWRRQKEGSCSPDLEFAVPALAVTVHCEAKTELI